jgi:predicted ATPase
MSRTIDKLTIEGYKSIRKLEDFELRPLNVLIGANGAGKSNFVGFFRLLRALIEQRLQRFIQQDEGGADACLYLGPKVTRKIAVKLHFGRNGYEFSLVPTVDNRLVFASETTVFHGDLTDDYSSLGSGHVESKLTDRMDEPGRRRAQSGVPHYVFSALSSWVVYHFPLLSKTAFRNGIRADKSALL